LNGTVSNLPKVRHSPPRHAGLNPKQRAFVHEYLKCLVATDAARAAGYKTNGGNLLKHPKIAAAIQAAMDKRAQRTEITQDRVLLELARIGFSDIRTIFDEDGHLKPPHEYDDHTAACIASIEVVERPGTDQFGRPVLEYVHKIRLVDKSPALALICRHLGMLNDKIDLTARLQKAYETAPDQQLLARVKTLLLRAGSEPQVLDGTTGVPVPAGEQAPPPETP
jgi:phage terminase small subunit